MQISNNKNILMFGLMILFQTAAATCIISQSSETVFEEMNLQLQKDYYVEVQIQYVFPLSPESLESTEGYFYKHSQGFSYKLGEELSISQDSIICTIQEKHERIAIGRTNANHSEFLNMRFNEGELNDYKTSIIVNDSLFEIELKPKVFNGYSKLIYEIDRDTYLMRSLKIMTSSSPNSPFITMDFSNYSFENSIPQELLLSHFIEMTSEEEVKLKSPFQNYTLTNLLN